MHFAYTPPDRRCQATNKKIILIHFIVRIVKLLLAFCQSALRNVTWKKGAKSDEFYCMVYFLMHIVIICHMTTTNKQVFFLCLSFSNGKQKLSFSISKKWLLFLWNYAFDESNWFRRNFSALNKLLRIIISPIIFTCFCPNCNGIFFVVCANWCIIYCFHTCTMHINVCNTT